MKRREFLQLAAAVPAIGSLWDNSGASSAFAATNARKLLVLVYLKGGNDGYNTFAPYKNAKYKSLRPTLALHGDSLIHVTDTHGFHPSLAALMPAWKANDLALLQGIGQQEITNQHYRDLETQFTGASLDEFYDTGWLTRAMLKNPQSASGLDAIAFDDLDIREADPMGPFRGQKLKVVQMQYPSEWLAARKFTGTKHLATLPARALEQSFQQPTVAALKTQFPADPFADALKSAVQLTQASMAPPVIHITLNGLDGDQHSGFDTHWNQLKYHGAILQRLAVGIAAFREAMIEIGEWNNTLIATYDEFGRSPKENDKTGTHHGWASSQFMAGGRIKGGLHGEAPPVVDVFALDGPPPVIDYRELYTTMIENWWGGSANGVFSSRFKSLDILKT
jgi:uncharacterized protein (DUF1501 family)